MAKKSKTDGTTHEPTHVHDGCEFRAGPAAGTAIVSGSTFQHRPVQYAEIEGRAIFEGDIVLGTIDEVRDATATLSDPEARATDGGPARRGIGITGSQFRWPNARIPYEIAAGFPNPQRVTDAIAHWEANTRIRFVLRTAANASQHSDYVRFASGSGCSSAVGRRGGVQTITLGDSCSIGNAIHEIGHVVGLWHEQSRQDRGTFVQVQWANIDPAAQHNFNQHISDGDDLGNYDYGSIMHYHSTAFSINGQPTLVPLQTPPPGTVIGQRNGLSLGDIAAVHAMYPAVAGTRKEISKDPLFDVPTIKEISKDPLLDPGTFKELTKDPLHDPGTFKEPRFDPGTIKEGGFDPGGGTFVEHVGGLPGRGGIPFVMGGVGRGSADPPLDPGVQLRLIGEALVACQEQLAQIAAAYDATVQILAGLIEGDR